MILSRASKATFHLLMGLFLTLVYPFQPLFSGNQNVYFLWAFAKTGVGSLPLDPLLQQADPFPLFSFLIYSLITFLKPWIVYILYSLIGSIYTYSIFGITNIFYGIYKRHLLPFTALFLVLHASEIWGSFLRLLLNLDLRWIWDSGLAEQGVLRGYFQPSVFGVFLILSIYRFLKKDERGAFLSLAIAGIFHANYLFFGGIMGLIYFGYLVKKGDLRQTLLWSIVAISFTLPYLVYTASQFIPSSTEEGSLLNSAVQLTMTNNPHLDLSLWLNVKTFLQFLILFIFLFLHRNNTLGKLSLMLFSIFSILSIIAFTTKSTLLLSLNPWRISAILFPIASMLTFWKIFSFSYIRKFHFSLMLTFAISIFSLFIFRIFGRTNIQVHWQIITIILIPIFVLIGFVVQKQKPFSILKKPLYFLVIVSSILIGIFGTFMELRFRNKKPEAAVQVFLKNNSNNTTLIVTPTNLTSFRLATESAIVADKNLVYGLSLSNQLARISEINNFYNLEWEDEKILLNLMKKHSATTIVVPVKKELPSYSVLKQIYQDDNFLVLEF